MSHQIDNTFNRFARPISAVPLPVFAILVGAILLTGLVISLVGRSWTNAVVFTLSIVVFVVFARSTMRRPWASDSAIPGRINWRAASPEIQRQDLTIAVRDISRVLEVGNDAIGDLQSAFIVAEDLALRQIQQEEGVPILRHISIGDVLFDAAYVKDDLLVCGEVLFLVSPAVNQDRIDAIMTKAGMIKASIGEMNIGMSVRLMLVIITQMQNSDLEQLNRSLGTARFSSTPVDIDIRLLDFETLQRIFVSEK